MIARADWLSMSCDGMDHAWIIGKDYNVYISDGVVHVESEGGAQDIDADRCEPSLFAEVFGLDITA